MLELAVKLFPQVEHDVLSGAFEEDRLKVGEDEPQHLRAQEQPDEQVETIGGAREDIVIDRPFRKLRLQHLEQVEGQRKRKGDRKRARVRFEIPEQTLRDLKVVSLADGFFFVKLSYCG